VSWLSLTRNSTHTRRLASESMAKGAEQDRCTVRTQPGAAGAAGVDDLQSGLPAADGTGVESAWVTLKRKTKNATLSTLLLWCLF